MASSSHALSHLAEMHGGVRLDTTEGSGVGRRLIATRAYSRGDTVLSEEAVSAALNASEVSRRCDWSLKQKGDGTAGSLLRCSKTRSVRYRSAAEQRRAWQCYFKHESDARLREPARVPGPSFLVVARLLWRCRASGDLGGLMGVQELVTHWADLPDERKAAFAQAAITLRSFIAGDGADTVDAHGDSADGEPSRADAWPPPVRRISSIFATLACNGYASTLIPLPHAHAWRTPHSQASFDTYCADTRSFSSHISTK